MREESSEKEGRRRRAREEEEVEEEVEKERERASERARERDWREWKERERGRGRERESERGWRGRESREGGGQGGGEEGDAEDRRSLHCRRTDPTHVRIPVGRTDAAVGSPRNREPGVPELACRDMDSLCAPFEPRV